MAEHTQGPWKWWTSNGLMRLTAEGAPGSDGGVLCAVRRSDGFADIEVSEADARLIAAAPDTLAALKAYHAAFGALFRHCCSNGVFNAWQQPFDCTSLNEAQSLALHAIAKATEAEGG